VIILDTGLPQYVASQAGILCFSNLDEACGAVENLLSRYDFHRAVARELAEVHLDGRKVLGRLLELSA